jgi:hypothetical protein
LGKIRNVIFGCTGNLKGKNLDPDVDGKDAKTDIKKCAFHEWLGLRTLSKSW